MGHQVQDFTMPEKTGNTIISFVAVSAEHSMKYSSDTTKKTPKNLCWVH